MDSKYRIFIDSIIITKPIDAYKVLICKIMAVVLFVAIPFCIHATDTHSDSLNLKIPALLYTDITRGPAGSTVTIWGQNIPSNPKLTCGNQPCEILEFINDSNHPKHGMQPARQKIIVQFNSGSDIKLNGYNSLPFEVTTGQIHMINPGPISLANVDDGDVVYLRGGKYDVPQGGSINAIILPKNGVSVVGYPGERAIIDCRKSFAINTYNQKRFLRDFTIANLEMDCGGSKRTLAIKAIASKKINLRVVGNYVHDAHPGMSGALGEFSETENLYVLGNRVENTGIVGGKNAHAIYHGGRGESSNVNINYNTIINHSGGRAIQVYGHQAGESLTKLTIKGNHIKDINGKTGIILSSSDQPKHLPYNDPKKGWIKDAVIEDNTIENVTGPGIEIRNSGINILIKRNVIFNVTNSILINLAKSATITNNCLDSQIHSLLKIYTSNNHINYPACLQQ
jgi:hypothetical protein